MREGYGEAAAPMLEKRAGDCAREGAQSRAVFWADVAKAIRALEGSRALGLDAAGIRQPAS